jgi:hypothetical protein
MPLIDYELAMLLCQVLGLPQLLTRRPSVYAVGVRPGAQDVHRRPVSEADSDPLVAALQSFEDLTA